MLIAGQASEEAIARAFEVHRRTLNQRPESEGTTLRRLLDEARCVVGCQLLSDSGARIDHIAGSLGYSGPTAFGRA